MKNNVRVDDYDMVWLAGVLEAKSTISTIKTKGGQRTPKLYFSGREATLREAARIIGVGLHYTSEKEYDRVGCTVHCDAKHIHVKTSTTAYIQFSGARAHVVLWNALPWLRLRRSEVDSILASCRVLEGGAAQEIYESMSLRGWQTPEE